MTAWLIGAYGADMGGASDGISLMTSRPDGSLELVGLVAETPSPTFLAERHGHVYAAAEGSARVESFRRDALTLHHDGGADTGGMWPCQLEFIDGAVISSNYHDGTLGVISLDGEGVPARLEQVLAADGSGPHPEQTGPHAHASFRLDEHTVLSADLGADRVRVHAIEGGRLRRTGEIALPPGTGPRDIARHSSGLIYVLGEHGCTLTVFEIVDGMPVPAASVALPGREPADQAAAIGFSADGRFVYAGLRGSNRIAVLRASDDGHTLTPLGSVSAAGDWPRHLAVDADVLHVANQRSNSVASFRLGADGMPVLIAEPTPVASPTYLLPVT